MYYEYNNLGLDLMISVLWFKEMNNINLNNLIFADDILFFMNLRRVFYVLILRFNAKCIKIGYLLSKWCNMGILSKFYV
jgi:hypothetical protein